MLQYIKLTQWRHQQTPNYRLVRKLHTSTDVDVIQALQIGEDGQIGGNESAG